LRLKAKVLNNCHIYLDKVNLESLEIVGNRFQINKCEGIFPSLREIGTFFCLSSDVVVFPNLEIVKGNFKFSPPTKKTFTPTKKEESPSSKNLLNKALQWFSEESIKPVQEDKIELEEIIIKKKYNPANPFPKLKIIGGDANFDGESYFHSLETIKCLNRVWHSFEENYKVKLPSLKTVGTCVIDRNTESIFNIIKNPYFRLARTIFFSKKDFFIANSSSMSTHERLPLEKLIAIFKMRHSSFQSYIKREYERQTGLDYDVYEPLFRILEPKWEEVKPLTYKDIFTIKDWALRRFCFNYIGVSEMMKALEATRIATEGIELNYYRYDENGNKVPFKKHNIYEVYEANVNKIQELRTWRNNERKIYAVKCWCTSTNHEHWLWIEEQYRHDPLTAIASTFRIHENVIPFIKRLKRQGDILICELRDEVIPEGDVRPLTKREYFRLLEVET
jgi:hypothetical protein